MTILAVLAAMVPMPQVGSLPGIGLAAANVALPKGTVAAKVPPPSKYFGGGPPPRIAPYTKTWIAPSSAVTPMVFPVLSPTKWDKGFNQNRGTHRHTGVDIAAPKLTPIVAPFSGVLGFKVETFWIYADNGFFCLGTHLNDDTRGTNDGNGGRDMMFAPNLKPGDRVQQGQLIGWVGNSGETTGPHLHFELFDPKGRIADPFPSLKRAYRMARPKPILRDAPRPEPGIVRIDAVPRFFDPQRRYMTVAAVTRYSRTRLHAFSQPTRYRVRVPKSFIEAHDLAALPKDGTISIYVREDRNGRGGEAVGFAL